MSAHRTKRWEALPFSPSMPWGTTILPAWKPRLEEGSSPPGITRLPSGGTDCSRVKGLGQACPKLTRASSASAWGLRAPDRPPAARAADCRRAESHHRPEDLRPDLPGPHLGERREGEEGGWQGLGARQQGTGEGAGACPAASPDTAGSSERPGLPRLTGLAATTGGLKRQSPAKTPHSKGGSQGAEAEPPQGGKGSHALHSWPRPAWPAPAAPGLWGACATRPGRAHFRRLSGRGSEGPEARWGLKTATRRDKPD